MAPIAVASRPYAPEPAGGGVSRGLWAPVSSKVLKRDGRRLEAATFLTDGYGIRQRLEAQSDTMPMSDVAAVWQPSRLKGYQVEHGKGLPFLSAGQVFESRPRVRKWLAPAMIPNLDQRYVDASWLLMSCSGEVGRVTAVYQEHLDTVITHDLLRVVPKNASDYGWLYAYMKTPTFFAIARSAQYGHMIKHLEPEHVLQMPVAMPGNAIRTKIGHDARQALELRQKSRQFQHRADDLLARLINPTGAPISHPPVGTVNSSALKSGRRRLEGQFHRTDIVQLENMVRQSAQSTARLADLVYSVSVGARFKRYFGANGVPYRSASELFDVNPPVTKRIYSVLLRDAERYMLHAGWIIMACSGQTYGLLGRTTVLTEAHEGIFGSHDLIRIIPDQAKARTGYLHTLLNHSVYGRPRVVRYASGTSIPHLEPPDIRDITVPRFDPTDENRIADLADESIRLSAEADRMETKAVSAAEQAVASLTGRRGILTVAGADDA